MENGQVSEAVAKATREALDQFHLPGKHKQKEHEKRLHPKARAMLKRFKKMSKSDVRRGDEIRRLRAQMRRDAAKEGVFLLE